MYYFFDLLFGLRLCDGCMLQVFYGAQFLVSRRTIQRHPVELYQFLAKFVSYEANPVEAYVLERLWSYLFSVDFPVRDKYKLFGF